MPESSGACPACNGLRTVPSCGGTCPAAPLVHSASLGCVPVTCAACDGTGRAS